MRAVVVVCLATATAHADTPRSAPTEIAIDRDDAPPGRVELGFDGGAPVHGFGISLAGSWLEEPLVLVAPDGGEAIAVRRRQTVTLGGALAIGARAVVDARWSYAHQVGDRLRAFDSATRLDRFVPGDLRLGARLRVTGGDARAVFVRADLSLPTGDERDYAGEPSWSLAWRLIGRARLPAGITSALTAGLRLRGEEVVVPGESGGDRLVGNELVGAAGLAVDVPPVCPVWCEPDQVRVTAELAGALGDAVGGARGPSPLELRAGIVTRPWPQLAFAARAGIGLVDELGAPGWRLAIELAYVGEPRTEPPRPGIEPADDELP